MYYIPIRSILIIVYGKVNHRLIGAQSYPYRCIISYIRWYIKFPYRIFYKIWQRCNTQESLFLLIVPLYILFPSYLAGCPIYSKQLVIIYIVVIGFKFTCTRTYFSIKCMTTFLWGLYRILFWLILIRSILSSNFFKLLYILYKFSQFRKNSILWSDFSVFCFFYSLI